MWKTVSSSQVYFWAISLPVTLAFFLPTLYFVIVSQYEWHKVRAFFVNLFINWKFEPLLDRTESQAQREYLNGLQKFRVVVVPLPPILSRTEILNSTPGTTDNGAQATGVNRSGTAASGHLMTPSMHTKSPTASRKEILNLGDPTSMRPSMDSTQLPEGIDTLVSLKGNLAFKSRTFKF